MLDALDRLELPEFRLALRIEGAPRKSISAKRLTDRLKAELASTNPQDLLRLYRTQGLESLPNWDCELEGCLLNVRLIPKEHATEYG